MNSTKVQATHLKIKSEHANLAIPVRESYLPENILLLQETHKTKQTHGKKTKPSPPRLRSASSSRQGQLAHDVSLEDLVYLLFPKKKKLN